MMPDYAFFFFFSGLTLGGAVLMLTRRNPVLSAVWLIVSLIGVAGLFLLLGAEFLFAAQIILYVGGITLLFLFVIMLVNLESVMRVRQFRRSWPLVLVLGATLAAEFIILLERGKWKVGGYIAFGYQARGVFTPGGPFGEQAGNAEQVADTLFTRYLAPFEVTSVLLLAAIVGAVWMGQRRQDREETGEREAER
jgi:NADH-quinone oxidoreductase subunit J